MNRFKRMLGIAAMLLAALVWVQPAGAEENLIDTIKKRGKLQVGFASFVPWAMRDCVFRRCRAGIPKEAGPLFRVMPG